MTHYDIIIIGTGAGGGAALDTLKHAGKRILVLERGTFMPREQANWDAVEVFQKGRYHNAEEDFYDDKDEVFQPEMGYYVGGNTKVYGAAMFRLRERDFERVQHAGGVSPEWPMKYADFEPYYTKAEKLFNVHGKGGIDPNDPPRSAEYPHPPVSHEPVIQEMYDKLRGKGYSPSYLPLGIRLNEADRLNSACIRCPTCDGFPCLIHAKADADINCVRPATGESHVTLLTNAQATRLVTSASGTEIKSVEVESPDGAKQTFSADMFVVACGAINSSLLFLQSATDQHPNGLANKSDQVGRNFMKHLNAAMMALSRHVNPTVFQKTIAFSDFYFGEKDYEFPMGHVQLMGKSNKHMIAADAPSFAPGFVLEGIAEHTIDWWLTGEDLPDPNNRVQLIKGKKYLNYQPNNEEGFNRLRARWKEVLQECDVCDTILDHKFYLGKVIPLAGVAHQNGTMRFGTDPMTSVLDLNCKTHEIDNLYVVDGSFFVSAGAVNPSLTIIANAIRIGEHLIDRMK